MFPPLLHVPYAMAHFAAIGFALGLVWLSYHWFFSARVKRSLILAFLTHNPIALAVAAYVASLAAAEVGVARVPPLALLVLLVGLWLPIAAWETARKVRLP